MVIDLYTSAITWLSVHLLPLLLVAIVAIIATYIGSGVIVLMIRKIVHGRHFGRAQVPLIDIKKRQDTIINLALILWKIVVFVGSGLAVFTILFPQVNLLPVLASAGVVGAIIGFGAQSVIRDFIAGISIIAENQFRVGDRVEIEGGGSEASGRVEHITLRSTVLRDDNGDIHYVANGSVMHVVNKTTRYEKIDFVLKADSETDIEKAVKLVDQVGESLAEDEGWKNKIIEAPHFINIDTIDADIVKLNISGKTVAGAQRAVTAEMKKRLLNELPRHKDIRLSWPTALDLSLLSGKKKR